MGRKHTGRKTAKQKRRRGSGRKQGRGRRLFKPITVERACEIGGFRRAHFYRIRDHLRTKHLGRRVLVDEHSVYDYLESLPS